MNQSKWLVLTVALGMMAATGGYLFKVHQYMRLGAPGVKVGPALLYDETGRLAARQSVLLPDAIPGFRSKNLPVTQIELGSLPKDTTFGRKVYSNGQLTVQTSVVLMGSDRTSIHQPQYCLDAQGWRVDQTDRVMLSMDHPTPYQVPALKLTTSREEKDKFNQPILRKGFYVYWFVSADRVTSDQGARLWSIAKTMLEKGELERWAYISYFATCLPGQEEATFKQLERFIQASAPEFQTVAGQSFAGRLPIATR
jgi:hypothetical protein